MQQIPQAAYKFNSQTNEIKFFNGSEIIFKDLFSYPSDPNFDELGSLEITGCFIDEAVQIKTKARNIVKSRIRYKLDEYGLIPKILYTSNPGKGWLHKEFYIPSKTNILDNSKQFIQSLLTDNPFISAYYADNLESLDKESKERLKNGNWDYEQEGLVFPEELLNRFELKNITLNDNIYAYADISDGGGDYYSFIVGMMFDKKVYILDCIYTKKPSEYWMPITIEMIKKYDIQKIIFESNNQGLMATKLIKQSIGDMYNKRITAVPNSQNKHTRITVQAEMNIIPNFIFLSNPSGMYDDMMNDLCSYRYDKSYKVDDAPDSLAGLSILTNRIR
jgi:predicted phage terminase large subunit-like protein